MSNGDRAMEALSRYLRERGWSAERMTDQTAFTTRRKIELATVIYYFEIETELEQFLFYIAPEINLFQHQLPPMAEFVCRANLGMRIGNFELNYKTGQLSFKSSLNFKGLELSPILIDNVIEPALTAFDEFFPAAARVFAGLDTPADAVRKVEYGE